MAPGHGQLSSEQVAFPEGREDSKLMGTSANSDSAF